jgi:glycosyltransferase involved in cell wall biosynthesis
MKSDFVSIILPVYNGEKYIASAIESILNQSHDNFELILINDGSKDSTEMIINHYVIEDKRIKFVSRENKGLIYTLNQALSLCTGRFIARMDADDISFPNRIKHQLNWLLTNNQHAMVGSSYLYINENDNVIGKRKVICDENEIKNYFLLGNPFCHPSVMFNRDVIGDELYYDEEYETAEDFELWLRLSRSFLISNIPDCLLKYRINPESITSNSYIKQFHVSKKLRTTHFGILGFYGLASFCENDTALTGVLHIDLVNRWVNCRRLLVSASYWKGGEFSCKASMIFRYLLLPLRLKIKKIR